ncbi:MAG TPA: beta-galactosidase trimerization domain-containing protein [Lentisphaeria bacterium]|nr:beta-galactosidase trimerization domain-containing protein [Lentisphaeria bacterium]
MHPLRFRQIHLDFHTSPAIPGIGLSFDKDEWQATLRTAHVNSITLFAKCHHGWHYHFTQKGLLHPNLSFDLLRSQFDACKEIDINVPIYISAGLDSAVLAEHPEWEWVAIDPATLNTSIPSTIRPGFRRACFNSPYTEYLAEQITETLELFPNCDGIFLDIVHQYPCGCVHCLKVMRENGLNPLSAEDRDKCAHIGLERYYQLTTQAITNINAEMPVFHNSGHLTPGKRDVLKKYFSHLELESLPTGGWGYDHFPLSAKYAQALDLDFLGMTGKFHTTWGEFGGYKHRNALRYECAAMLAFGAKCSVGDQLHPCGKLDESTYDLIAPAYAEVAAKEPWCDQVTNVAEIGLLTKAAVEASSVRDIPGDIGAGRVLLEGHFLFDVIDQEADFNQYRLLILPDDIAIPAKLKKRLDTYLNKGGKLLLTGKSGLGPDGKFLFDLGAECQGPSPYRPDFVMFSNGLQPAGIRAPMVMYLTSQRIQVKNGNSLGDVYDPYFNRTSYLHFCSHQHTPWQLEPSGYAAGVQKGPIMYFAHPVFSIYRGWGNVQMANFLRKAVRMALGDPEIRTNLPSTARLSLMDQKPFRRTILHLLYANTVTRGGHLQVDGVSSRGPIEVIEELVPLNNVRISLKPRHQIKRITLEPQGGTLLYETDESGRLCLRIDNLTCHQMVVLHW